MQPIHMTYTPDRADFAALLANERTPAALRIVFFGGVVAMSGGLGWLNDNNALFAALTSWSPPWGEVATVAVMVVVMYGALIGLRGISRRLRAARAASAACLTTFTADDDGITVTAAGRSDVYPWRDVRSVWLSDGRVFVALPAGRVLALPSRAFTDEAAMAAFALAAEARLAIESEREDAGMAAPAAPEAAR